MEEISTTFGMSTKLKHHQKKKVAKANQKKKVAKANQKKKVAKANQRQKIRKMITKPRQSKEVPTSTALNKENADQEEQAMI